MASPDWSVVSKPGNLCPVKVAIYSHMPDKGLILHVDHLIGALILCWLMATMASLSIWYYRVVIQ